MTPTLPNATPVHLSEAKRKLLERYLRGEFVSHTESSGHIGRRSSDGPVPLALAQEQIWQRCLRIADEPPLYNESVTLYREGALDVRVLERCFDEILRRHEAWRTSFDTVNGAPVQWIHPLKIATKIRFFDLQGLPDERREEEAIRLTSEQAVQPFDFVRGPLLRLMLFKLADSKYRFNLIAHQSIIDGVSIYQVFPSELATLYDAFSAGRPSPLSDLPIQYADFAIWQREWLKGDFRDKQVAYWRRQLAGKLPTMEWGKKRSACGDSYRGVNRSFALPSPLSKRVQIFSRQERTTLFTVLVSAFAVLLRQYTGQDDVLVGTLSPAGRKRSEVQGLLGYFLNPVALRFNLPPTITFRDLLKETSHTVSEAISNDDVPLEVLAQELNLNTGREPFVKIALSLQPQVPTLRSGWNVTSMDAQNGGAVWDLYLAFIEGENGLTGRVQFNPDIFDETLVMRTLQDLWKLMTACISNPEELIGDLLPTSV
jgi:hypothetical protein